MPFSRHLHIFLSVGSILSISLLPSLTFASPLSSANTLAGEGIISSQSSESGYRLSSPISRGEMMKVAVKLAGENSQSCQENTSLSVSSSFSRTFSDVSTVHGDLCGYIERAASLGMIQRADTRGNRIAFRPAAFVTRAEMTKILVNALGLEASTSSTTTNSSPSGFTDISGLGDLAGYINRVAELGCAGSTNTLFRPKAPATRGEVFDMAVCLKEKSHEGVNTQATMTNSAEDSSTGNTPASSTNQQTNTSSLPYLWTTGSYGACSASCGEGIQTRTVTCKNTLTNTVVDDSFCTLTNVVRPVTQKLCNVMVCGNPQTNTTSPLSTLVEQVNQNVTVTTPLTGALYQCGIPVIFTGTLGDSTYVKSWAMKITNTFGGSPINACNNASNVDECSLRGWLNGEPSNMNVYTSNINNLWDKMILNAWAQELLSKKFSGINWGNLMKFNIDNEGNRDIWNIFTASYHPGFTNGIYSPLNQNYDWLSEMKKLLNNPTITASLDYTLAQSCEAANKRIRSQMSQAKQIVTSCGDSQSDRCIRAAKQLRSLESELNTAFACTVNWREQISYGCLGNIE